MRRDFVARRIGDDIGHRHPVRIALRFNAGRDVDAFTEHVRTGVNDFTHMDADADVELVVGGLALVVVGDAFLAVEGALHGILGRSDCA